MQELVAQLYSYLIGVWRFRWVVLGVAWAIALAGWGFVTQIPEQYRATARINVDTNSVLRPLLRGLAIQPNIDERVALMSKTLLSRPNLEKLMRMADLDITVQTEAQKENLLKSLGESIKLGGDRRNPSLYSVSFIHQDPAVAKRVVQSLITVFIESALGDKRQDTTGAQSFLDQQIADYEKRLIESEAKRAEFKQRYVGILPGESGGYYSRLSSAKEQLNQAKLQLREMENRRNEIKRQLESGEDPMFMSEWGSALTSPLDSRIQALQARRDELLTKYTEKHPEIIQINSMIEELEAQKQRDLEAAMMEGPSEVPGMAENPVYQQTRALLSQADASVAELKVRVAEYEQRVKDLEDKVNSIPLIEAELTQLNRDYDVIRNQHEGLLKQRERAKMGESVEQSAGDVVFRVVDPPFVPRKPDEPNKLLLNSIVLVIALGVGFGIGLVMSLLRPVFVDRRTLGSITGLPVLGSVTAIRTALEKRQSLIRRLVFSSLSLVLLFVFASINVVQQWMMG